MKIFSSTDKPLIKDSVVAPSSKSVCMHVRGVVRHDARVLREATALVGAGFTVSIVDIETEASRPSVEDIGGVHVKHLYKPEWLVPSHSKLRRVLASVQKLLGTTYQLIRTPADVYHAHDVSALLPCYIAAQLRRKPVVLDAHEMPLYELEGTRQTWIHKGIKQLFSIMVHRCAGVITVSPLIIQELYERYHLSNVCLVRNIPPYRVVFRRKLLHQHLGLHSHTQIVLYQGNLQPDRGLDVLVKAATFLEKNVMIVLMGKNVGSTLAEIEALIDQEGVADRVKIIPPVPYEELLDWTASADIGVNVASPDYSLNVRMFLPNKLFEYLMAGLPILSSPLAAMAEIIDAYKVGHVLASLEPLSIAGAINAMLEDRAELEHMRHNAREATRTELCWENESQQLIHLYRTMLISKIHERSV